MAQLVFTQEDERLIESLMEEFDPRQHPACAMLVDFMPASEWDQRVELLRDWLRKKIRMTLAARAYIVGLREAGLVADKGIEEFFHGVAHPASLNFGIIMPGTPDEEYAREIHKTFVEGNFGAEPGLPWQRLLDYTSEVDDAINARLIDDLDPWKAVDA